MAHIRYRDRPSSRAVSGTRPGRYGQSALLRFELIKDGRFRIDALAPGVRYNLNVLSKIGVTGYVAKEMVVRPGESKNLRDCKVVDITR
jgi:hypothetical protein